MSWPERTPKIGDLVTLVVNSGTGYCIWRGSIRKFWESNARRTTHASEDQDEIVATNTGPNTAPNWRWVRIDHYGVRWTFEHHEDDSPVAQAMLAAQALAK